MWAVMYGGRFDGLAVLVEDGTTEVAFPDDFNLKKHSTSHDYKTGEFVYERNGDNEAVGHNINDAQQRGFRFTPKVPEFLG